MGCYFIVVLFLSFIIKSISIDNTFSGTGNWNDQSKWSLGFPGNSSATAFVTGTVTIDNTTVNCASISVGPTGTLFIIHGSIVTSPITNDGTISVSASTVQNLVITSQSSATISNGSIIESFKAGPGANYNITDSSITDLADISAPGTFTNTQINYLHVLYYTMSSATLITSRVTTAEVEGELNIVDGDTNTITTIQDLTLSGVANVNTILVVTNMTMSAGALRGPGVVNVTHLTVTGSPTIDGDVNIVASTTVIKANAVTMKSGSWQFKGICSWLSGSISMEDATKAVTIMNEGVWSIQDSDIGFISKYSFPAQIVNKGEISPYADGSLSLSFTFVNFINYGTVKATLTAVNSPWTAQFIRGSSLQPPTLSLSDIMDNIDVFLDNGVHLDSVQFLSPQTVGSFTLTLSIGATVTNLNLAVSTLIVSEDTNIETLTINGPTSIIATTPIHFNVTKSVALSSSLTFYNSTTFNIPPNVDLITPSSASLVLEGNSNFNNYGTINATKDLTISTRDGAVVLNNGMITVTSTMSITSKGQSKFYNVGLIEIYGNSAVNFGDGVSYFQCMYGETHLVPGTLGADHNKPSINFLSEPRINGLIKIIYSSYNQLQDLQKLHTAGGRTLLTYSFSKLSDVTQLGAVSLTPIDSGTNVCWSKTSLYLILSDLNSTLCTIPANSVSVCPNQSVNIPAPLVSPVNPSVNIPAPLVSPVMTPVATPTKAPSGTGIVSVVMGYVMFVSIVVSLF
eukprot:TRINITY_DN459_c0_g1_i1.p1 TRINITY_DN459_c0_g1~~TRINITY_DN459_c0_g1_i1.p1  ORF type:complete len:741 (+),score=120.23 TRINITY_DN459_c0_g1_i1:2-2224(+)